jgi:hypothetical protein
LIPPVYYARKPKGERSEPLGSRAHLEACRISILSHFPRIAEARQAEKWRNPGKLPPLSCKQSDVDLILGSFYHLAAHKEALSRQDGEAVMAWRKWIVRGIVYGIIGAAASAALVYQRWTNPSAVREQVIAQISKVFPGAHVSVDSARLRILGGIQLNGLRLTRADDPDKHEFLHVPSAIFYHDKEKILERELILRKIELIRPRLRVRRGPDGRWNLQDLMGKPSGAPQAALPAIVIHQGTLILEDRSEHAKASSLEINDISLTIINDPVPRVTIRGAANSDLLGKLHLQGSLDRLTSEAYLSFRATQIPLTQSLLSRLPIQVPSYLFDGLQLSATASVEGKVSYHPSQPTQPVYYDVQCEVQQGKLQHPQLPLPLTDLHAKLHCSNSSGLQLEMLTARSGKTEIEAQGAATLPRIDQEFEVSLDLKHVQLGRELADRLPVKIRNLHDMFQPNGPTTIHIDCAKHEGQWVLLADGRPSLVSLRPEGLALAFKNFPYPLERTEGAVDYNLINRRVDVDLKTHAGDRPVILWGHWTGEGAQADVDFNIQATDVPIDEKLSQALHTDSLDTIRHFAESFHPTGLIDVKSYIRHEPGQSFRNEFHIHFHEAAVKWDHFPYPLTQVSGFLNIYPDHWEFKQFQGTHQDGHVLVHGKSTPKDEKGESHGIELEITGRNVRLDDDLREALRPMPKMYDAWETFNPTGDLYFTASVQRPSADLNDLEIQVDARGGTAKPKFFPYRIQDISGQFRFRKMCLEINKLRAKHEQAMIALDNGTVALNPRGGYFAKFLDLQVQGMQFDDEFVQALPGKLKDAVKMLRLDHPLRVKTQLVIAQPPETGRPPDVYWDGQAWMYGAKFTTGMEFSNVWGELACRGRYDGRQLVGVEGNLLLEQATLFAQPFKKVHARLLIRKEAPDVLLIGLRAPIFSGDVTGQIRVNLNSALDYEMNLTASQINVAEFGRHNLGPKSQISGTANARIYLKGLGTGIASLDGNGALDIPHGHLYNLPFLLDLLKFLGLHWPDHTAFEEFHAAFGIQGSKVNVQRIDLLGSAVSLSGKGEFDLLTKEPKLDVYPMWGRIEQLLPPMLRPFPTTFSKNLLTVEVRGKVSGNPKDLKFQMKPVPVILDPLLLLRDRVIGAGSSAAQPEISLPPEADRKRGFRIWD